MAAPRRVDELPAGASWLDLSPMDAVMRPFGGLAILYIYDPPRSGAATFDLAKLQSAFVEALEQKYRPVLLGELLWDPARRGVVYVTQDGSSASLGARAVPFVQEPKHSMTTPQALASLSYELFMPPPRTDSQIIAVKCSLLADGGLAIGVNVSHCVFDGEAMFTFMKVWGQYYRGVGSDNAESGHTVEEPIRVSHDRHLLAPRGAGPKLEHPEFRAPPSFSSSREIDTGASTEAEAYVDPNKSVPPPLPPTGKHVFHITPVMMDRIKTVVGGSPDMEDYSYVSTIDSLTALFIALITRARGHERGVKFTTGVNARRRFNPPLPTNYVGNVIFNAFSTYTADELRASDPQESADVSVLTLRAIARRVRASINRRDDEFLRDAIEFIGAQEDMGTVQVGTDFFFGPDLMFTSWVHMGMYDADFGGGKASYACVPTLPCCDGMVVFIEAMHHEEGLDVIVLLEMAALDRLMQLWSRLSVWK